MASERKPPLLLFRGDSRAPAVIFKDGFEAKGGLDGVVDLAAHVQGGENLKKSGLSPPRNHGAFLPSSWATQRRMANSTRKRVLMVRYTGAASDGSTKSSPPRTSICSTSPTSSRTSRIPRSSPPSTTTSKNGLSSISSPPPP
ncbi:hypothetical protein GOP47_0019116 [Adiantum capillus-veneris]|uniref:Uncharacterized protein n=1 Tax=Adiantum capillus-veneris TaxID=13818 RepID=A0A9D4UF21_ADICA|nr:hypothetical protein GOP47_0019116 [Adiantum capillus-veneris]